MARLVMRVSLALLLLSALVVLPTAVPAQPSTLCNFHSAVTSSGTGNACAVAGNAIMAIQVSASPVTVFFQGSVDETNYVNLVCINYPTLAFVGGTTTPGLYLCKVTGMAKVRANITAIGSTAVTIKGVALQNGTIATLHF